MRQFCTYGSVRGAGGNLRPYRNRWIGCSTCTMRLGSTRSKPPLVVPGQKVDPDPPKPDCPRYLNIGDAAVRLSSRPKIRRRQGIQHEDPMSQLHRITVNPNHCGGRPCIRGLRMRVKDVLDLLAAGVSRDDILATWEYAARQFDHPILQAA